MLCPIIICTLVEGLEVEIHRTWAQTQAQTIVAIFHSSTPPEIQEEICQLESLTIDDHQAYSEYEIQAKVASWVPHSGHTRGRCIQYLNSITLHWKMEALMGRVLKEMYKDHNEIIPCLNETQLV